MIGAVVMGALALVLAIVSWRLWVRADLLSARLQHQAEATEQMRESMLDACRRTGLAERHRDEYLEGIHSLIRQRDEWKRMFKESTQAHLAAHNVYERTLLRERALLRQAWNTIQADRKARGEEPLERVEQLLTQHQLDNPPIESARAYAEKMIALFEAAEEDIVARELVAAADARVAEAAEAAEAVEAAAGTPPEPLPSP